MKSIEKTFGGLSVWSAQKPIRQVRRKFFRKFDEAILLAKQKEQTELLNQIKIQTSK